MAITSPIHYYVFEREQLIEAIEQMFFNHGQRWVPGRSYILEFIQGKQTAEFEVKVNA